MTEERTAHLLSFYRTALLEDVIPFWMIHSRDNQEGGYFTCLDRDGSVYHREKYVWPHGRMIWMFSALYNRIEPRSEWLEMAAHGVEFLLRCCRNPDGLFYFHLTRDGKDLDGPISIYSDFFAVYGLAEYSRAAGDARALETARKTYWSVVERIRNPRYGAFYPFPSSRHLQRHTVSMILLETTQELASIAPDPKYTAIIDECLERILYKHTLPNERALFENLSNDWKRLDSMDGRLINPGHAIESMWFVLHQARRRNDLSLINRATDVIEWSLERGWDREYGGIFYFIDSEGKPLEQLEWFMKLWWPHTEALYATLLAYRLTGRKSMEEWFERIHEYAWPHFQDTEFGEWYGYLDRQGNVVNRAKGTGWKSCFHLPRALLLCVKLLEEMAAPSRR
jgi:N-acylglucosamine 2-epimerase